MSKLATILLCANFVTVMLPQPGYIHPDEFFQSSEIVAGDILEVKHYRAWEFDVSSPVRSIVFPYITISPSMALLKWMNSTEQSSFQISANKVIMASRLPLTLCSVFGFLVTSRLAHVFGASEYLSTVLWCSSYVTWAYFTRTFSNSIEAVLFSVLLLLILSSPAVKDSLYSVNKYGQADSTAISRNSRLRECVIGMVVTAGFFNRPTFLAFAGIPVLYWLNHINKSTFVYTTICASLGAVLTFCSFVITDSVYYNPLFTQYLKELWHSVVDGEMSSGQFLLTVEKLSSSLVVTPWNFIQYNMKSENLAQHGTHPRYTHILVNLPLLTGPLFFPIILVSVISIIGSLTKKMKTSNRHSTAWLAWMMLFPVLSLSIFPHQEPRFLIPLLPILVVLGAKIVDAMSLAKVPFFILWTFFNIFLFFVYCFLHQAALVPSLSIYQQKLSSNPSSSRQHHAIFYKTYPPPQHLLLTKSGSTQITVHDLAGSSDNTFIKKVKDTRSECLQKKIKCRIYLFLPSTVTPRVMPDLSGFKVETTSICPHVSMESPPRLRAWWSSRITFDEFIMDFCLNLIRVS